MKARSERNDCKTDRMNIQVMNIYISFSLSFFLSLSPLSEICKTTRTSGTPRCWKLFLFAACTPRPLHFSLPSCPPCRFSSSFLKNLISFSLHIPLYSFRSLPCFILSQSIPCIDFAHQAIAHFIREHRGTPSNFNLDATLSLYLQVY